MKIFNLFKKKKNENELSPEVRNGMDFLDEHGPIFWWEEIDVDKLNMSSASTCVLGQLARSKFPKTNFYGYGDVLKCFNLNYSDACRYGFDTNSSSTIQSYTQLEDEWMRAIDLRWKEK